MAVNNVALADELKQLVADVLKRNPEIIKPETNFWQDLGVDSIKAIELVVSIERKFKVSIRDEEIPQITTFAQALSILEEALKKYGK